MAGSFVLGRDGPVSLDGIFLETWFLDSMDWDFVNCVFDLPEKEKLVAYLICTGSFGGNLWRAADVLSINWRKNRIFA